MPPDNAPDTASDRRLQGGAEHARQLRRSDVAHGCRDAPPHSDHPGLEVGHGSGRDEFSSAQRDGGQDWGVYAEAIRRWERIIGVPPPAPTVIGARGGRVLNPALAEWMMGIPGRVTDVPGISRNEQLKLIGNGVVPQQAVHAVRVLHGRLRDECMPAGVTTTRDAGPLERPALFRKRPVEVQAMRWTEGNPDLIVQWVRSCVGPGYIAAVWRGMDYEVRINTLEGPMKVSPGDWVIRGVKGEFYPCKPDVFDSTYEIVEANE